MKSSIRLAVAAIAAIILSSQTGFANAGEIKVYSTIGVQAALADLTPKFEKASGHKLAITWGTAPMLIQRIQGGESADVMVLTRAVIDTLSKEGNRVCLSASGVEMSGLGAPALTAMATLELASVIFGRGNQCNISTRFRSASKADAQSEHLHLS